jgi:hypothetical protein
VFLFGKSYNKVTEQFETVTIKVKNLMRNFFIVPAQNFQGDDVNDTYFCTAIVL